MSRRSEATSESRSRARTDQICGRRPHLEAFSLSELVIGALILGAAIIPMYYAFIQSSRSVSSSRLAYMAMQVARETMEELRQVPVHRLNEVKGLYSRMGGRPLFAVTAQMRSAKQGDADPNKVNDSSPKYPDEYNRIVTAIAFEDVPDQDGKPLKNLKKVVLDVSWTETGGKNEKQRPGLVRYVTLLGSHSIDPEVRE